MSETIFNKELAIRPVKEIVGMYVIDLTIHDDNRGWFKENWHYAKMVELGLPDFSDVQQNIAMNYKRGTTRGLHAEPWNKLISIVDGKAFGAWVDLREGETFGNVFTTEIDPSVSVYIPKGVANSYQTLEDDTSYSYLVDDHWSKEGKTSYRFLNLNDPTANIDWPIPLEKAIMSDDDKTHPQFEDVIPFKQEEI